MQFRGYGGQIVGHAFRLHIKRIRALRAIRPPRRMARCNQANMAGRRTKCQDMRDRDIASETLMIDLYAMGSPNVVKIYIALEEMGLPYTVHPVDVFGEAQFSLEFLRLNPNAKVPVIVDDEGPGGQPYTVFESGAILVYLADKSGQFLAENGAA